MSKKCIFCQIIKGETKAWKIYEDALCVAFLDVFPVTEGHVIIATKEHIDDVFSLKDKDFVHMNEVAHKVALVMKQKLGAEFANIITAPGVIKHAFIHVVPRYDYDLMGAVPDMENKRAVDEETMEALAKKLKMGRKKDAKPKA